MDESYDIEGWATRCNVKCSDGRTILPDAFKDNDGQVVPLVWNHDHNNPENVLGHAMLENRGKDGVYTYVKFNDTENGQLAKELCKNGDITRFSICANKLTQQGGNVLHGMIREVSLVLAGANPGAVIKSVISHSDGDNEEIQLSSPDNFELYHSDAKKNETQNKSKEGDKSMDAEQTNQTNQKGLKEIVDSMTEEQKRAMYAIVGMAVEDVNNDDKEDNVQHSDGKETFDDGGNTLMHKNIFESQGVQETVLTHADEEAIIKLAKQQNVGTLKLAIEEYFKNSNTLAHSIDEIDTLFPEFKDLKPGAPELLTRDNSFVDHVINGVHKTPFSRIRVRYADARAGEITAKGYQKTKKKTNIGNIKLLKRTTDPQTIYVKDAIERDDIIDITDFDVVEYQYNVMKMALKELIALSILIGDGRSDEDADKVKEDHIRPIWTDNEVYTIHGEIDFDAMKKELQGTNTSANFGDNYVYAEAIVQKALYLRETYKGSGNLEFYCTPHLLNTMLLARDLNGRRIYSSKDDLAKALNVKDIITVEQFDGQVRSVTVSGAVKKKQLLGIFINLDDYNIGSTKGGEMTKFSDFDINFNRYEYLLETRLSGSLIKAYSAIVLEEDVTGKKTASGNLAEAA
jgi:HK97 family phage prohead protease